jgi:hypothetical protein
MKKAFLIIYAGLCLLSSAFARHDSEFRHTLAPRFSEEIRTRALELFARRIGLPSPAELTPSQAGPRDKDEIARILLHDTNKQAVDSILYVLRNYADRRRDLFQGEFRELLNRDIDLNSVARLLPRFFEQKFEGNKIGQWIYYRDQERRFYLVLPILHLDPRDEGEQITIKGKIYDYVIEILPFLVDESFLEKQYQIPVNGPNRLRDMEEELFYSALTQLHIMSAVENVNPVAVVTTPEYWDMSRLMAHLNIPIDDTNLVEEMRYRLERRFSGRMVDPATRQSLPLFSDPQIRQRKVEVMAFLLDASTGETLPLKKPRFAAEEFDDPESVLYYTRPNSNQSRSLTPELFNRVNGMKGKSFDRIVTIEVPYFEEDQLRNCIGTRRYNGTTGTPEIHFDKTVQLLRIPYALREKNRVGVNPQILRWLRDRLPQIYKDHPESRARLYDFLMMVTSLANLGEMSDIVSNAKRLGAFIEGIMETPILERTYGNIRRLAQSIKALPSEEVERPTPHDRILKLCAKGTVDGTLSVKILSPHDPDFQDLFDQLVEIKYATAQSLNPPFPTGRIDPNIDPDILKRYKELGVDVDDPEPGKKYLWQELHDPNKITLILEGQVNRETDPRYVGKKRLLGSVTITISKTMEPELRKEFAERWVELLSKVDSDLSVQQINRLFENFFQGMERSSYIGSLVMLPQLKGPGVYLWHLAGFITAFLGRDPETGKPLDFTYAFGGLPPIAGIIYPDTPISGTTISILESMESKAGALTPKVVRPEPLTTLLIADVVGIEENGTAADKDLKPNQMIISADDPQTGEEIFVKIQAKSLSSRVIRGKIDDFSESRISAELTRDRKQVRVQFHGDAVFFSFSVSHTQKGYAEIARGISAMLNLSANNLMDGLKNLLSQVFFCARLNRPQDLNKSPDQLHSLLLKLMAIRSRKEHPLFHPPMLETKSLPSPGDQDALDRAA